MFPWGRPRSSGRSPGEGRPGRPGWFPPGGFPGGSPADPGGDGFREFPGPGPRVGNFSGFLIFPEGLLKILFRSDLSIRAIVFAITLFSWEIADRSRLPAIFRHPTGRLPGQPPGRSRESRESTWPSPCTYPSLGAEHCRKVSGGRGAAGVPRGMPGGAPRCKAGRGGRGKCSL